MRSSGRHLSVVPRPTFAARRVALRLAVVTATGLVASVPSRAQALTVRPDRPRLLFSNGQGPGITVQTFKDRCTQDGLYKQLCQASIGVVDGSYPALNLAANYLVNGDPARCTDALAALADPNQSHIAEPDSDPNCDIHCYISNNGRSMLQLAGVRDWCDAALGADQKAALEATIVEHADWYLANYGVEGKLPADVYHDDMANVWNSVALAGLALKGTSQDAKADEYLAKAEAQWKGVILPAMVYEGDWWHEGFSYVQPTIGSTAVFATTWTIATDDNIYTYSKAQLGDLFEGYFRFHAHALRPDLQYVMFGDSTRNKQGIAYFSRLLLDMMNYGARSSLGQGVVQEISAAVTLGNDITYADGLFLALLYDESLAATPRSSQPTGAWLSRGAQDVAIFRSGWGPDDTYVYMSCGDYFGAHQHMESGGFQIFRHAQLTGTTGGYDSFNTPHWHNWYNGHSVHANTLAIHDPNELFPTPASLEGGPNVNDGGQRPLRRDKNGSNYVPTDLDTYKKFKTTGTAYETGDLKLFEDDECYGYAACDVTAAYNSTVITTNDNQAKVSEVSRQMLFLRPDVVVMFDRVESTDPAHEKRFLLHGAEAPTVDGQTYTITNGPGRLISQTLLPAAANARLIDNWQVDGMPYPPDTTSDWSQLKYVPDPEMGKGVRVEVVPATPATRDYFLHVMLATDPNTAAPAPASIVSEDDAQVVLEVQTGGATYTISLRKQGELGGHIVASGAVTCDQALGDGTPPATDTGDSDASTGDATDDSGATGDAPTSSPTGGGDEAGSDGDGGGTGAGTGTGTGTAGDGSGSDSAGTDTDAGCGCSSAPPRPASLAALALLLALRRRRPRV